MNEITESKTFDLSPRNIEEALKFADYLAKSTIVPKDFSNNPGNILVAIQWGMELGLKPMQAMQNIAVINGRPSVWGDAVLAMVLSSSVCKDVIERYEGEGENYAAVCIAQRNGREDKIARFSLADAKAAGLLGKSGPWTQYRDRMLKMRARAFALRDQFADVLKGMPITEEAMDIPAERDVTPTRAPAAQLLPEYPQAQFDKKLSGWKAAIEAGNGTADELITTISTRYSLTTEQIDAIKCVKVADAETLEGEQV